MTPNWLFTPGLVSLKELVLDISSSSRERLRSVWLLASLCCLPLVAGAQEPIFQAPVPMIPEFALPENPAYTNTLPTAADSAGAALVSVPVADGYPVVSNSQTSESIPMVAPAEPPASSPFIVAPVIVGLPTSYVDANNQMVVQPKVQLGSPQESNSAEMDVRWMQIQRPSADLAGGSLPFYVQEPVMPQPESALDVPSSVVPSVPAPPSMPLFESIVASTPEVPFVNTRNWKWLNHSWFNCCPGEGLGQERLPFALMDIDPAQPFNNFRVRMQSFNRWKLPDRAEYLWQRTADRLGPSSGESYMDFQQATLRMETGSRKISTAFEVPFRATNPDVNRNHAGLGDMQLIVKTVLIDGEQWMITQYFGTSFPTGSSRMGLGRGKVALEPGLLIRNRLNDRTWNHSEVKFWFPLAGDPQHSGQVLKVATGFNRVFWETDRAALIPTLEFSSYAVLNGLARDSAGTLFPIDGDTMLYITPSLHYSLDRKGDFGLFEIATGLSQAVTRQQFADSTWTFDVRWCW